MNDKLILSICGWILLVCSLVLSLTCVFNYDSVKEYSLHITIILLVCSAFGFHLVNYGEEEIK